VRRLVRWYGANPLHLLALLAAFALVGYAAVRLFEDRWVGTLVWFVGAIISHDLVLLPLYSLADRSVSRVVRHRRADLPRVRWVNHLRIPALLSLLLLLVWFPLVFRLPGRFAGVTTVSTAVYLGHWLLVTAALFLISAGWFALRLRLAARRPQPAPGKKALLG
jgi:hypothetical protein